MAMDDYMRLKFEALTDKNKELVNQEIEKLAAFQSDRQQDACFPPSK